MKQILDHWIFMLIGSLFKISDMQIVTEIQLAFGLP